MSAAGHGRQSGTVDLSALDPLTAGAVAEAIVGGYEGHVAGEYPRETQREVLKVARALWAQAGGGATFGAERWARLGSSGRASSGHGQWMGSGDAADALGVTPQRVGQLAAQHGLGRKVGGRWLLTASEVEHLRRRNRAA